MPRLPEHLIIHLLLSLLMTLLLLPLLALMAMVVIVHVIDRLEEDLQAYQAKVGLKLTLCFMVARRMEP
jgi:hypothetical protein